MDENNEYLLNNIKAGNPAVYVANNSIYVRNNGKKYLVCNINDIPITKDGQLRYNVYNCLAACSALVGINLDYCIIAKGFTTFSSDEESNPGRFNEYDLNGIKVVLDYGHNIDGYNCVLESLKMMPHKRLIGVIGVPGDRRDDSIEKVGEISAKYLDKIYIKEDLDKRGRKEGEVARILEKGVLKHKKTKNIDIILDEVEALDSAINNSIDGDVIVVFFEEFERLVDYLKEKEETSLELEKAVHM
jgi:cyanophycin synthetase